MRYGIVKILSGDDFEERENPVWCLVDEKCGDSATFCSGEYFGYGASSCAYEYALVESGGITCPDCLTHILRIKRLKI